MLISDLSGCDPGAPGNYCSFRRGLATSLVTVAAGLAAATALYACTFLPRYRRRRESRARAQAYRLALHTDVSTRALSRGGRIQPVHCIRSPCIRAVLPDHTARYVHTAVMPSPPLTLASSWRTIYRRTSGLWRMTGRRPCRQSRASTPHRVGRGGRRRAGAGGEGRRSAVRRASPRRERGRPPGRRCLRAASRPTSRRRSGRRRWRRGRGRRDLSPPCHRRRRGSLCRKRAGFGGWRTCCLFGCSVPRPDAGPRC